LPTTLDIFLDGLSLDRLSEVTSGVEIFEDSDASCDAVSALLNLLMLSLCSNGSSSKNGQ
ncbi:689_t:CDS:1, partial [Funneliformis mosseae]